MKILHTADVHLRDEGDERWRALEEVVALASREQVDLLVVCGDLFDKAGWKLRPKLRTLFSRVDFRTLILPGNHDRDAFEAGQDYGPGVEVFLEDGAFVDLEGVRVHALPFSPGEPVATLGRLRRLQGNVRPGACNILLFHGELLDSFYSGGEYGNERGEYMPVRIAYLDALGFDYVLAGHFHRSFSVHEYRGGVFVYPGSPVSVTRRETGRRKVNLFEVGKEPVAVEIESSYFDHQVVVLDPFGDDDPIEKVRSLLERKPALAKLILEVRGFVDLGRLGMTEDGFSQELARVTEGRISEGSVLTEWRDVASVVGTDLCRRFQQRLCEVDEEIRDEVEQFALEAMMEVR